MNYERKLNSSPSGLDQTDRLSLLVEYLQDSDDRLSDKSGNNVTIGKSHNHKPLKV